MTALELIEESKRRTSRKLAVDRLEQKFVDVIGYLRTTSEQLQQQGVSDAVTALDEVAGLCDMPRVGYLP